MKNLKKIISAFLAVIMVLSLGACSDLPKSSNAQWGYKYADKEYAIGIHVYSVFSAYSVAYETVTKEQGDFFDSSKSILDFESTFDESNEVMLCSDWIREEADRITKNLIVIDMLMDKYEVELDEQLVESARQQARKDWYLGPYYEEYASYGSVTTPYKDVLVPYGVSFESYFESTNLASVKLNAIFDKLYNKGGIEEVPVENLYNHFEKNYTSYGCFTVNFYETATDASTGESVNTPFEDKKIKEIKEELEYYLKMIENGTDFNEIGSVYAAYAGLEYSPIYQNIEIVNDGVSDNLPDEVVKVLNSMAEDEAQLIYVGNDDSRMAYFIYKNPIKKHTEKYVEESYSTILQELVGDEFFAKLDTYSEELQCELNSEAIDDFSAELIEKVLLKNNETQ